MYISLSHYYKKYIFKYTTLVMNRLKETLHDLVVLKAKIEGDKFPNMDTKLIQKGK